MDTTTKEFSYIYGFMLADGHLWSGTGNKGKMSIELNVKDIDILEKIHAAISKHFNCNIRYRTRITNYNTINTCIFTVCSLEFRTILKELGFPVGKKDELIDVPKKFFYANDLIRGYIDGNGTVCTSANNIPLISICTKSDKFADFLKHEIYTMTNYLPQTNRNKRDNIYNIYVSSHRAVTILKNLYYKDCMCLNRKFAVASDIIARFVTV